MKQTSITSSSGIISPMITSKTFMYKHVKSLREIILRKVWLGFLVIILVISPITAVVVKQFRAEASTPVLATDVVGQLDDNGDPSYTKNLQNNSDGKSGFDFPRATVIDPVNHRLFVDSGRARILVFNLDVDNNLIDRVADYVLGQEDFFSVSDEANVDNLASAHSLAMDTQNSLLFVADHSYNRIMIFDVATITDGEDAVHVLGQPDFVSSSTGTTQSALNYPQGVTYDSINNLLFVSDTSNNRIMVFDVATITDGEDAVHVLGQPDFDSSNSEVSQNGLNGPEGLSYDSDNSRLFVSDVINSRIMIFDVATIIDGEDALNVLGQVDFVSSSTGTTQSTLWTPEGGLAYEPFNDYLFVGDSGNSRVMIFDVDSVSDGEDAVNVLGQPDFVSFPAGTTQNSFASQEGIAYDPDSARLYVADSDNERIMIFDVEKIADGEDAIDVLGQTDFNGDPVYTTRNKNNGYTNELGIGYTEGDTAIDSLNHRLFIADSNNNRVLVYNLDSNDNLLDRTADYVLGQANFYTSDLGSTINTMVFPAGIEFDLTNNRLFVTDSGNHRVLVFDTTEIVNGENAINVLGQEDFTSNSDAVDIDRMTYPYGLALDSSSNILFVADYENHRVLVFDIESITDGEDAVNVLGQPNFNQAPSTTTQNGMNYPYGLAFNATSSQLFVADSANHRVLVFDTAEIVDGEDAVNVLGQEDFTSNDEATTISGMRYPSAVEYNAEGNRLYVADSNNSRILIFDSSSLTDNQSAIDVIGQSNFTSSNARATRTGLNTPIGLYFNPTSEQLLITDSANYRILVYDLSTEPEHSNSTSGSYKKSLQPITPVNTFVPEIINNPGNPLNPHSSSGATLMAPVEKFLRNLGFGSIGEDVRRLQQFLNLNEYTLTSTGAGSQGKETTYFGPKTQQALKIFQETFAPSILTPLGLTSGTGYFGNATRGFVNSLLP